MLPFLGVGVVFGSRMCRSRGVLPCPSPSSHRSSRRVAVGVALSVHPDPAHRARRAGAWRSAPRSRRGWRAPRHRLVRLEISTVLLRRRLAPGDEKIPRLPPPRRRYVAGTAPAARVQPAVRLPDHLFRAHLESDMRTSDFLIRGIGTYGKTLGTSSARRTRAWPSSRRGDDGLPNAKAASRRPPSSRHEGRPSARRRSRRRHQVTNPESRSSDHAVHGESSPRSRRRYDDPVRGLRGPERGRPRKAEVKD